jgi:hypothetical protein
MKRLTTPTHIFELPFDADIIDKIRLVYAQNDNIILCKEINDCECTGQTVTVQLSQEETAKFDCKRNYAEIQAHILTVDGKSLVSNVLRVSVEKCLDTGVLV